MGFSHKLNKDKNIRYFVIKNEINVNLMKYTMNSIDNIDYKKYVFYKFLKKFHLNSSSSRVVNRCIKTGRASWILRKFRLSRMSFKELADMSQINGVRRATW